jgi:hypothetical protein
MSEHDRGLMRAWRGDEAPALPQEEVVYGVTEATGVTIFTPHSEAERFSRQCRALSSGTRTWGEVRAVLLPDEVEELYEQYEFGDETPAPPPDSAPFSTTNIPAFGDGDWPRWPPYDMFLWFPLDVAYEFGTVVDTTLNGPYLLVEAQVADAAAAGLTALGVRCVRDDALASAMFIK